MPTLAESYWSQLRWPGGLVSPAVKFRGLLSCPGWSQQVNISLFICLLPGFKPLECRATSYLALYPAVNIVLEYRRPSCWMNSETLLKYIKFICLFTHSFSSFVQKTSLEPPWCKPGAFLPAASLWWSICNLCQSSHLTRTKREHRFLVALLMTWL